VSTLIGFEFNKTKSLSADGSSYFSGAAFNFGSK